MRRVQQIHVGGCGIACVAMAARVSYKEALRYIRHDRNGCTKTIDVRAALRRLGIRTHSKRLRLLGRRHYTELPFSAILKIPHAKGRHWHWVIWDHRRRKLIDPDRYGMFTYRASSYLGLDDPSEKA